MKLLVCCILLISFSVRIYPYEGEKTVDLFFQSISNLKNPTYRDFKRIEDFLQNGDRPYLTPLSTKSLRYRDESVGNQYEKNSRNCRWIKLVGDNGEMPVRRLHVMNTTKEDKSRCIGLFATYNYPYPGKLNLLVEELRKVGYKGHILLRIGGFPDTENDGIMLCHIPFSWKVAMLEEMQSLGYENVLWLDASMHPIQNIDYIFQLIESFGYLVCYAGFTLDHGRNLFRHLPRALNSLGVTDQLLTCIPHLASPIIGLDLSKQTNRQFLKEWMRETKKVTPCINWYPEELCFSVVAWRYSLLPYLYFGDLAFTPDNYSKENKSSRWFYCDYHRVVQPQWDPALLD